MRTDCRCSFLQAWCRSLVGLWTLCSVLLSPAQVDRVVERGQHAWLSHWGDHRVANKWSLHTELHLRRAEMGALAQQLLLRPAVNYHMNEQTLLTAGYSYYENYRFGEFPLRFANWEHHAYAQAQLTHRLGKLALAHRYRIEHRWIAQVVPNASGTGEFDEYRTSQRLRYRLWFIYPLGKKERFSANAYWELFLLTRRANGVDGFGQNRLSAMVGYKPSKEVNLLLGYLQQDLQRSGAANGLDLSQRNATIHLAAVINLDLRRRRPPKHLRAVEDFFCRSEVWWLGTLRESPYPEQILGEGPRWPLTPAGADH
jgi:Protein of unknown function (DUF2490)